jgi:lipoate-protein ligase A
MAVDESILEAVGRGSSLPTLRLYAWSPACLSLGYAQPVSDADEQRLSQMAWDLVRRPTGGKAILHTDELTYAVISPQGDPRVAGSVLESYRNLSRGLMRGLALLGLEPEAKALQVPERSRGAVCFEVASNYEIAAGGRKLVGSAQLRRRGAILQHGSLPLEGDLGRIVWGLRLDEQDRLPAMERVRRRAISLSEALGEKVSWEKAAGALAQGFAEALSLAWLKEGLTAEEQSRSASLCEEKYRSASWNRRV